ncbi:MAG: carboxymuconolactone decarboxylase family protein [Burkholderiales bacterium]|nr:carboxymuconolactone decarboxylase family protein [Burkholderiales bacterium]
MTQQARLPYHTLSPEAVRTLRELSAGLEKAGLPPTLIHLVRLRASQINDCGYCIDKHAHEALAAGETEARIAALAGWRSSSMFDAREKAALAWTETLTLVAETGAPDADFDTVRAQFSEKEVSDLSFVIATINAWNRIAIGFRQPVPTLRTRNESNPTTPKEKA